MNIENPIMPRPTRIAGIWPGLYVPYSQACANANRKTATPKLRKNGENELCGAPWPQSCGPHGSM